MLAEITCEAQNFRENSFRSPLTIPLFLSGNFGELRSTHFHAGIDLKTEGVTGKPVLAANEGFISRIKIQSGGYGNSIYLTHPDGYTTVYAHLDRFIPEVQAYVEAYQYEKERFEVELFPSSSQFVFGKGDLIAYSGNTGRSGGPHLHFEIRKTNGQVPQNGLLYDFPVADILPPEFRNLYVYGFSDPEMTANSNDTRQSYRLKKRSDTLYVVEEIVELKHRYNGFGTEVYDFLNGSANKCGVYSMSLEIDNIPAFAFAIDQISFSHTRYINAHMDYALKKQEGQSVHRLYSLPNNQLPIYWKNPMNGLFTAEKDSVYHVSIRATDAYGNTSRVVFRCRLSSTPGEIKSKSENLVEWDQGAGLGIEHFNIRIPPGALYRDAYLDIRVIKTNNDILMDTLILHDESEPLHRNVEITLNLGEKIPFSAEKMVLARVNGSGQLASVGGETYGNKLIATTRNFGRYVITADTVPPEIRQVNYAVGQQYRDGQSITFTATDDLTGLDSYNAYVDGKWVLMSYDAKSDRLTYRIDGSRIGSGMVHTLRVVCSDAKGNTSEFNGTFRY